MTLALRDEFTKTCLQVGREVEHTVIEHIKSAVEGPLTDEQLEKAFEPLVKFVEGDVEQRIRQEIEDVRAAAKEKKSNLEDERVVASIRTAIDDSIVLYVNGKRKRPITTYMAKRLRGELNTDFNIPELKSIKATIRRPTRDLENLDEDEIHSHFPYSEYWDKYCPKFDVHVEPRAEQLVNGSISDLAKYIETDPAKTLSLKQMADLLDQVRGALSPTGNIAELEKLLNAGHLLLRRKTISRKKVVEFLCSLQKTSSSNCGDFLTLFKVHQTKQTPVSPVEPKVVPPVPDVPAVVTVEQDTRITGTCLAHECQAEVFLDSDRCPIQDCVRLLCDDCSMADKVCEDHMKETIAAGAAKPSPEAMGVCSAHDCTESVFADSSGCTVLNCVALLCDNCALHNKSCETHMNYCL
jgi:hypothetical protein